MNKETVVVCPTCKADVVWSGRHQFRPFCSERCRLIDLGEWASDEKRIPGEAVDLELNEGADGFLH